MQGNVNLSRYSHKGYAAVVLSDSDVTYGKERKEAAFDPFFYCVLFIYSIV